MTPEEAYAAGDISLTELVAGEMEGETGSPEGDSLAAALLLTGVSTLASDCQCDACCQTREILLRHPDIPEIARDPEFWKGRGL